MVSERDDIPPFADRDAAGRQLARYLEANRDRDPGFRPDLVLAIPRGGVAVAAPIATALGLPLDVLVARKVGAPLQPELAIGAVTRFGEVWNQEVIDSLQLSEAEVGAALAQAERELSSREKRLRAARPAQPIVGRSILLVDDGWATGATAAAGVQGLLRAGAAKVIAATPVAAPDAVERLGAMGAETVVLVTPTNLRALGEFYRLFFPITTDACIELLIADGPRTPRSRLRNPSSI
jgi:putative phosphoribosyl transferase